MAAHLVLGMSCLAMCKGGNHGGDFTNMRSGQLYGNWTEDFHGLIAVSNSFTIPREDLFDHPESVQGGDLQKFCQGFVKQQQKHEEIHCFGSIEEVLSRYGNILDRVPDAKDLDGSPHIVMSSREVAKEKEAAVCHILGGNSRVCHLVPVTLHEVVTQISDGSSRTLRAACHPGAGGGCHVLFPGDVIVSRSVKPPTVKGVVEQELDMALGDDGYCDCKDLSEDDCNNRGCCWHQNHFMVGCLPCSADDTITGVAQYAALRNSFTTSDAISGVVERASEMMV